MGFIGGAAAKQYVEDHPKMVLNQALDAVSDLFGAQSQVPLQEQAIHLLATYGTYIGAAGAVLILIGFALKKN